MKESEIPKGRRNYIIPGREDVFEQDGKFYLYMGKFAGWQEADRIRILPDGSISAISGVLDTERAIAAARKILREGFFS
ncbi:MAG: hypothetical protein IKL57_01010 [Oscillospiraceae bacterium]|nr:hypothetical protein [Oscillospiraceae bacterium]MBR3953674.1 hypothetical protein [Oscillospiraceae bacterium]